MKTDFNNGLQDGKIGVYDKWYRYNRNDNGEDYDNGIKAAINSGAIIHTFIEVNLVR